VTFNSSNRLFGAPYQYDAAGNLTNDGSHSYTYDAEGRMIQVDGGSTASYVYDAFGRRVKKTVAGYPTEYMYTLDGQIDSMMEGSAGHLTRGFVYLNGLPLVEYANGTTYFVHTDHLGSTRLLTNYPTPTIAESDDYYPFGEFNSSGSTSALKFTADERDTESTLDHTLFRQYSSSLGRWSSPDPLGGDPSNPQSLNRYAYVLNNPLAFVDPLGLDDCLGGEHDCNIGAGEGNPGQDILGGGFFGPNNPGNACANGDASCGRGGNFWDGGSNIPNNPLLNTGELQQGEAQWEILVNEWNPDLGPDGGKADLYIIVHCSGPGNGSWECSPWGAYAQLLASGWQPYRTDTATFDARANALAHALNATGVQSAVNPCTIAGFYAVSAIGGASGGALVGGEAAGVGEAVVATSAPYWPVAFALAYRQSMVAFAPFIRTSRIVFSTASDAVQRGCNALQ
jgi:RHS repeat-associated protein